MSKNKEMIREVWFKDALEDEHLALIQEAIDAL
jgi:hypothetical protein